MKFILFVLYGVGPSLIAAATFKAPIFSIQSNENGVKSWLSELIGEKFRCGYHRAQRLLGPGFGGDAGKDKGLWDPLQRYGNEKVSGIWVNIPFPNPNP